MEENLKTRIENNQNIEKIKNYEYKILQFATNLDSNHLENKLEKIMEELRRRCDEGIAEISKNIKLNIE